MEPKLNKTELHGTLIRLNSRMKFLRAAYYGSALPKDVSSELNRIKRDMEFVLAELKRK
jgi:hypothetical protein